MEIGYSKNLINKYLSWRTEWNALNVALSFIKNHIASIFTVNLYNTTLYAAERCVSLCWDCVGALAVNVRGQTLSRTQCWKSLQKILYKDYIQLCSFTCHDIRVITPLLRAYNRKNIENVLLPLLIPGTFKILSFNVS